MSIFSGILYPIIADCGHKTWRDGTVVAFGGRSKTKIPIKGNKTPFCHGCLEKMAIRCAWCGKPIFIGDPVTLYSSAEKNFQIPEYAVRYSENPIKLVGCMRWDCAETGADRCGFWLPPGVVHRVLSPIEQMMATGTVVVVADVGDMREAIETTKRFSETHKHATSHMG